MENVGLKMIAHASKILSLLPSLLHLPCPIPPAVTHICQCTCTAVLESFLSAHLNGLTGLRTKDFSHIVKGIHKPTETILFLTIHPSAYRRHPSPLGAFLTGLQLHFRILPCTAGGVEVLEEKTTVNTTSEITPCY